MQDQSSKPLKAMDFLPKDQKDLKLSSYWKKFFEFDSFKDGFEWYASFEDLKTYLQPFLNGEENKTIVPGCGNSDLSQKLFTDMKIKNLEVLSVDFEEQVIKKMEESKPKELEKLTYKYGDCAKLDYIKDSEYNVSVDKGTLDAIAVDDKPETVQMCTDYFNEQIRILNQKNGVFIMVSLLQPHVLKIVLDYFVKGEGNNHKDSTLFTVNIQRIENIQGYAEKDFIKYFIAIKKNYIDVTNEKMVQMREMLQNSISIKDDKNSKEEIYDYDKATEKIKVDQQIYMIAPTIKNLDAGRQIEMNCFDFKSDVNQKVPKYTLHVVDNEDTVKLSERSCAAIIVPQGRENESVFGTERGRQGLCQQANVSRCVVIILGHGHTFESLQEIQDELNAKILDLAPSPCSNYTKIPIMTAGADIGKRQLIDLSNDKIEGMIVQDIEAEYDQTKVVVRQAIFESKYDQIQSEMQIVYRDPSKHEIADNMVAKSELRKKKKGKQAVLNHDYLTSEYQQAMLSGLFMAQGLKEKKALKILHLGTGAGIMPSFLISQLPQNIEKLVTIDNNKDMLQVAEKYFGFKPDGQKLVSLCEDAHSYVEKSTEQGEYDIIILDINFFAEDDKKVSPPWNFLDSKFIQKLCDLANPDVSFIALNIIYYDKETEKKVFKVFNDVKNIDKKCYYECEESFNKVVMLSRNKMVLQTKSQGNIKISNPSDFLLDVQENTNSLDNMLKSMNVKNKGLWMKELEMAEHIKVIKALH